MPRYLIGMTQANAAVLEQLLGGRVEIVPSTGALTDKRDGAIISGLDAITDEEYDPIRARLATGPPLYHAGGPTGRQANEARTARQRWEKQQQANRAALVGEHVAEEWKELAFEHAIDGRVPLEDVLNLMTGAWETGRSPYHGGRNA